MSTTVMWCAQEWSPDRRAPETFTDDDVVPIFSSAPSQEALSVEHQHRCACAALLLHSHDAARLKVLDLLRVNSQDAAVVLGRGEVRELLAVVRNPSGVWR